MRRSNRMRATGYFVGRGPELARLAAAGEAVTVIYGVAGIGKTETAYQLAQRWADLPHLIDAPLVSLRVEAGARVPPWTLLAARLPRAMPAAVAANGDAALDWVVGELAVTPCIVVLDDAHLAPGEVAQLLDALGRRAAVSRVIATSRVELPLRTSPIVARLGPLDPDDAHALAFTLGERLARPGLPLADIVAAAAGSPFAIREIVAAWRPGTVPRPGALAGVIAALGAPERRALARLAAVASCPITALGASHLADEPTLNALQQQLLVDVGPDRLVVHEMVRDAVGASLSASERAAVREEVAAVARQEFARSRRPVAAVEALCQTVAAGQVETAVAELASLYPIAAAAGLDHLLLGSVERLARLGHVEAGVIEARILIRMYRIAEAGAALAASSSAAAGHERTLLLAVVAGRQGRLDEAARLLRDAIARARGPSRARLQRHLSDVLALRGDAVTGEPRLAGLALLLEHRFDEGAVALGEQRRRGAPGTRDRNLVLGMLEIIAAAEAGKLAHARAVVADLAPAWGREGLRVLHVELYLGVLATTSGALPDAEAHLRRAYVSATEHGDCLFACVSGHYLARALMARGALAEALAMFEATNAVAINAGFAALVPAGHGHHARALVLAGRIAEARAVAAPLASDRRGWARLLGLRTLALAAAAEGDLGAARGHIAEAYRLAREQPARHVEVLVDHAELESLGGDPAVVLAVARQALALEAEHGRYQVETTLRVLIAGAKCATGRREDVADVRRELGPLRQACRACGAQSLLRRIELLALAVDDGAAQDGSASPLAALGADSIGGPGMTAYLRFLGLGGARRWFATRQANRVGVLAEVDALATQHDLVVDVPSNRLLAGARALEGRQALVALLVALSSAAEPITPEALYQRVWGGEYHPLRNRNTLYIALNRARAALRGLLPGRDVICRAGGGWTIAADVDVCVVTGHAPGGDRQTL